MEQIKAVVENLIKKWDKERVGSFIPEELLKKVLTKKELEHIKFNYFKKGILGIKVDSSVWMYQLSLQKEKILRKLNSETEAVKDVRFRIGEIK